MFLTLRKYVATAREQSIDLMHAWQILWYAQVWRIRQPQNQTSFSKLLVFPNKYWTLLGGLKEAFRETQFSEHFWLPGILFMEEYRA